jgi:hypothetical protein
MQPTRKRMSIFVAAATAVALPSLMFGVGVPAASAATTGTTTVVASRIIAAPVQAVVSPLARVGGAIYVGAAVLRPVAGATLTATAKVGAADPVNLTVTKLGTYTAAYAVIPVTATQAGTVDVLVTINYGAFSQEIKKTVTILAKRR